MNLTAIQIAEAFSRHEFEKTYPYILDTIAWNPIGNELINGKEKVIEACQQSASYLATITTKFTRFTVIADTSHVVIDVRAEYVDTQQNATRIASCDIYGFTDGKLSEITSYTVQLS